MKLETFFEKFDQFADAPDAVAKMRELVLQLGGAGQAGRLKTPTTNQHAAARANRCRQSELAKRDSCVGNDVAPIDDDQCRSSFRRVGHGRDFGESWSSRSARRIPVDEHRPRRRPAMPMIASGDIDEATALRSTVRR